MSGLAILNEIKRYWPQIEVIMLTAQSDQKTAVEAASLGAYDFISKPYDSDHLLLTCNRAVEHKNLSVENNQYKKKIRRVSLKWSAPAPAMKK